MTLGRMIATMLQVNGLSTNQIQIIDMLCKINESEEMPLDNFKFFAMENSDEIWEAFGSGNIEKLILINSKEKAGEHEDTRIIFNFKYINNLPKFCYVRILWDTKSNEGNVKSLFNWNEDIDTCIFKAAFQYMSQKIRRNDVAPGGISTEISKSIGLPNMAGFGNVKKLLGIAPEMGSAEDIANAALYLASDESKYVNGAVITVDGGWTCL